jgi:succinate dehydrogenase hydrophobic anchor subunit
MPDWLSFAEVFKMAPAVVAMLVVIWLMYKMILKKDETMQKMMEQTKDDATRWAKMLTLLEILVSRGDRRDKE